MNYPAPSGRSTSLPGWQVILIYPGLLLFKMQLLEVWYSLSDPGVEDFVNDSLGGHVYLINHEQYLLLLRADFQRSIPIKTCVILCLQSQT